MFYDFTVKNNKGEDIQLSQYKGKVVIVVNTATKCGLTGQYTALEELYEKYKDQGLEILDFPLKPIHGQAPGSDAEIEVFCTLKYNTKFPRFTKVDVNGKDTTPLYRFLKNEIEEDEGDEESKKFEKKIKMLKPFAKKGDIKWNFGKFIIDREGNVVRRFSPAFIPELMEDTIKEYLEK